MCGNINSLLAKQFSLTKNNFVEKVEYYWVILSKSQKIDLKK